MLSNHTLYQLLDPYMHFISISSTPLSYETIGCEGYIYIYLFWEDKIGQRCTGLNGRHKGIIKKVKRIFLKYKESYLKHENMVINDNKVTLIC